VKIAELARREAVIGANLGQYLARFDPILFRRSQDRMVVSQGAQEIALRSSSCAAPQFREDDR
jgi:hypothetical protein